MPAQGQVQLHADAEDGARRPEDDAVLPAQQALPLVRVRASRPGGSLPDQVADPVRSSTTLNARALERRQAASVFGLLDEIPGVAVNGGPRASGMSFNIRGYTDSEDVQVRVDGVAKGFEKYRFGGTFIEPELLKSLEVRRGAQIESGVGALGGTVRATTRDAQDLLRPGQRLGVRVRLGHAANNDERQHLVTVYGRPGDHLDLLAAHSARQGSDLRLPDGERLALSSVDAGSDLLKVTWYVAEHWKATVSWLRYHDQGLQPYDTTGGEPGGFGQVQRRIDDETLSLRLHWREPARGHEWITTLGSARTRVRDHFERGWSVFSLGAAMDDDVDMQGQTLDTSVRWSLWRPARAIGAQEAVDDIPPPAFADGQGGDGLDLRMGLQLERQERASRRVTGSAQTNAALYPGGFNPSQPPGRRSAQGIYLQPELRWGAWQVLPGVRWDRVVVQALGPARDRLALFAQSPEVQVEKTSPSLVLSLDLVPRRWTLFAMAAHAFRPPLLDEAFSQGPYGDCNDHVLTKGVPGYPSGARVAPPSGMCGDLYTAETSRTREWGVSTRQPGLLGEGSVVTAKLTMFRNHTAHLLEFLRARPGGTGVLEQPGWERRHGTEVEAQWQAGRAFGALAYSRIRGTAFDDQGLHPLTTAPGDQMQVSLGWRWARVESVLRWRRVGSRLAVPDVQSPTPFVTQASYRLLGASLRWRINDHLEALLSGENLENTSYRLNNGFGSGVGTQAPGRNLRVSLGARY